ncbi:hypothetical protein D7B24_006741 [Verticillium nonalfalfae]|uniref:Uncharacterized protein n=1 Tax=Verticillium nonalfalfae TaxID=1051616 RepID=A0A3M9YJD3_9PEZI|nr:uncharacterized protein D7B24_006741 [Verticillium nonalfalfae]RNJ60673.1 hypothetical protein D7B24_006741 [Verticillium nonalfalfae]
MDHRKSIHEPGALSGSSTQIGLGLKFPNIDPNPSDRGGMPDANELAYQFEGSMRLQPSEEESINVAQYDLRVKLGNNGVNVMPAPGHRFWQFKSPHNFGKMRPRDGMRYIDPANVDHVFSGGQRTSHLVDAFKLSAVVDNEKYNFAYIDKKMAEIINEMTTHISKFDPKRPVGWIRYATNKVPVLRRPSADPFVTLELTVRLVRGRQNGLREPLSGQGPCQTALAVDAFLAEMARPRGLFQTVFPDYGGLLDGLDAEGKVLGSMGTDGKPVTLDEGPAPVDYIWTSDDEGEGNAKGAGRGGDVEDYGEGMEDHLDAFDQMEDDNDTENVHSGW